MKEKLIKELADALEMESMQINLKDNFRDYDSYDSLSELSVLAMLDSEFGVEIEMQKYNKYITVEDLLELVKSHNSK